MLLRIAILMINYTIKQKRRLYFKTVSFFMLKKFNAAPLGSDLNCILLKIRSIGLIAC